MSSRLAAILLCFTLTWSVAGSILAAEVPQLTGPLSNKFVFLNPSHGLITPEDTPFVRIGKTGKTHFTLKHFNGRLVLLNFWSTWCIPCLLEMPYLDQLQDQYEGKGLKVITITGENVADEELKKFFNDLDVSHLQIYRDPGEKITRALRVKALPTTVLIAPQGHIIGGLEGPYEWHDKHARKLIEHFLPNY